MKYVYAKPEVAANSVRTINSKDESRTVKAFDFEYQRIPGVFDGRRTVEKTHDGEILETSGVFVKGNAVGILMTVSSWKRETGKFLGNMQWNAFVHFTIEGTYIKTDKTSDNSPSEKYCESNKEWLEGEIKKFLIDPRMKEDICGKQKKKKVSIATGLDVGNEIESAYRRGKITYKDVEKCLKLSERAQESVIGSGEWQNVVVEVAEMIRNVYGTSYASTTGVSMCVKGLFGKDMPVLVENVRDYFRSSRRGGTTQ